MNRNPRTTRTGPTGQNLEDPRGMNMILLTSIIMLHGVMYRVRRLAMSRRRRHYGPRLLPTVMTSPGSVSSPVASTVCSSSAPPRKKLSPITKKKPLPKQFEVKCVRGRAIKLALARPACVHVSLYGATMYRCQRRYPFVPGRTFRADEVPTLSIQSQV